MTENGPINSSVPKQPVPTWQVATLTTALALGASLGPVLFLSIERLEPTGDRLFSFIVGSLLSLGVCVVAAGAAALLIVPRMFAHVRGTLAGIVDNITQASRAHADGNSGEAIGHLGRAVEEGAAWYSIGATRRFVVQTALGFLLAFGGIIGTVLLLSQNSLLREQNGMVSTQLKLLRDQNEKVDKQLELLVDQNKKIDQQTMVADAQKRGAFATEMFSILKEVAELKKKEVPKELAARIAVLTRSAVPYYYIDFVTSTDVNSPKRIVNPLSPERGQIIVALTRFGIRLKPLEIAGAVFHSADLRAADLDDADLSLIILDRSDFRRATLKNANLKGASLLAANLDEVSAINADFSVASFVGLTISNAVFDQAKFTEARIENLTFKNSFLREVNFLGTYIEELNFENVFVGFHVGSVRDVNPKALPGYPKGIDQPNHIHWVAKDNAFLPTISQSFKYTVYLPPTPYPKK